MWSWKLGLAILVAPLSAIPVFLVVIVLLTEGLGGVDPFGVADYLGAVLFVSYSGTLLFAVPTHWALVAARKSGLVWYAVIGGVISLAASVFAAPGGYVGVSAFLVPHGVVVGLAFGVVVRR